jgi:hypothetical protein
MHIEDELASNPGGSTLPASASPVSPWSGEQDTDTPARHAGWLATAIPGAELHLYL